MKNKLFINTGDPEEAIISIQVGHKKFTKKAKRKLKSQVVLSLIDKLLINNNIKISDLDEIEVYEGPGSFTGLRVGIAVANAIASALDIKINGKKQIVDAKYK
jgi:tRNA threonylcarbamoyladenosine biosynthesis protein TsaB